MPAARASRATRDELHRPAAETRLPADTRAHGPEDCSSSSCDATWWYTQRRRGRRSTPEIATRGADRDSDPRSTHFGQMRHETLPPDHLFGRRMETLTLAVLSSCARRQLAPDRARVDVRRRPVTELGREEADSTAGDGRAAPVTPSAARWRAWRRSPAARAAACRAGARGSVDADGVRGQLDGLGVAGRSCSSRSSPLTVVFSRARCWRAPAACCSGPRSARRSRSPPRRSARRWPSPLALVGARRRRGARRPAAARAHAWVGRRGLPGRALRAVAPGMPYNLVNYAAGLTPIPLDLRAGDRDRRRPARVRLHRARRLARGPRSPEAVVAFAVLVVMAVTGLCSAARLRRRSDPAPRRRFRRRGARAAGPGTGSSSPGFRSAGRR